MYKGIKTFNFWCYKVLPLVYDDSLSYYEVLCKCVKYINELIAQDKVFGDDIEQLKSDVATVQSWIDNYDTGFAEAIVKEYLEKFVKTVTFGISNDGYFVASVPDYLSNLHFGTISEGDLFGHLVLKYD
jgi:hypothetical protein